MCLVFPSSLLVFPHLCQCGEAIDSLGYHDPFVPEALIVNLDMPILRNYPSPSFCNAACSVQMWRLHKSLMLDATSIHILVLSHPPSIVGYTGAAVAF